MISKIDLDDVYGQMMLSEETSRQCVFAITGGNSAATTDLKRILRISRHTHNFPRKN